MLFFLSGLHFHGIFNKIILRCSTLVVHIYILVVAMDNAATLTCALCTFTMYRITSVNRVLSSQGGDGASSELCVIQLILHLNLNAARLQQILQGTYMYILYSWCKYFFYKQYIDMKLLCRCEPLLLLCHPFPFVWLSQILTQLHPSHI